MCCREGGRRDGEGKEGEEGKEGGGMEGKEEGGWRREGG